MLLSLALVSDLADNRRLELGYDNVSAFIDMFRRAMGTTPGRYFAADAQESRAALAWPSNAT
jgi:methylphosphotriester-DNA--protein-cysteine methyltransferase